MGARPVHRRAVLAGLVSLPIGAPWLHPTAAQCERVAVYPGYPGFHGFVTGLAGGGGETECLATLEAAAPGFDRAAEDEANLATAATLGLAGDPIDWTWENWMLIEAERRLLPTTCYTCAMEEVLAGNGPLSVPDPADPRLIVGSLGSTWAIGWLLAEHGFPGRTFSRLFADDHDLRAIAGMALPGVWNAPQMLDIYNAIVEELANGAWFEFATLLTNLANQGGYVPTPSTAAHQDQRFTIMSAIPVLSRLLTPFAQEAFV